MLKWGKLLTDNPTVLAVAPDLWSAPQRRRHGRARDGNIIKGDGNVYSAETGELIKGKQYGLLERGQYFVVPMPKGVERRYGADARLAWAQGRGRRW